MTASRRILIFSAVVIAALAVGKTLAIAKIGGQDFVAYYQAGERFWAGEPVYRAGDFKAYKYAPTLLPLFGLLCALPLRAALAVFAALNAVLLWWLPQGALRLLERDSRGVVSDKVRAGALAWGLVGSLRFIDGELYNAQVNALAFAFILAGLGVWLGAGPLRDRDRFGGAFLTALGSLFKFHPFFAWIVFLSPRYPRNLVALAAALLCLACVPDPSLWPELVEQLRATTPLIQAKGITYIYQGFIGVVGNLGAPTRAAYVAFAAFALVWAWRLPRFDLQRSSLRPQAAALLPAYGSALLLAVTGSPLPWQHTYIIWGALVPVAYVLASERERRWVIGLALAMGLSARGVVGSSLSMALEKMQIVFVLSLALSWLLLEQSRRNAGTPVAVS